MKKEDVTALIVYLLIIAVAVVFSLAVLRAYYPSSGFANIGGFAFAGFIVGAVTAGILSSAILLELGHIIGAKLGKYEIISVNIFFFMFYKAEKKWKFKFASFDGLTGETKIVPNEKSKPVPTAYLTLGTLFLALWGIGSFVIYSFNIGKGTSRSDLAYFFLTVMVVVLICLVYNILPLKLDTKNDGYSLRMMSNPENKKAYNKMLKVEKDISDGNNDIDTEVDTTKEVTNYTAEISLNKVYVLIDKGQLKEAEEILNYILDNKSHISSKVFLKTLCTKIYVVAINSNKEDAIKFLNESVDMSIRRDLSDENTMSAIRAYIILEALIDNSKSECLLAVNRVNKALRRVDKNRQMSESVMYNNTIDFVNNVHPKWLFDKYKIDLETIK